MSAIVYSSTDNYIYTYTVIHNYHALWPITLALYNVDKHNVHCAHTIIIFFQEPTLLLFIKKFSTFVGQSLKDTHLCAQLHFLKAFYVICHSDLGLSDSRVSMIDAILFCKL